MSSALPALLAACVLAAVASAAGPSPGVDRLAWEMSKQHFRRGAAHYKEGRFAEAEAEFRDSGGQGDQRQPEGGASIRRAMIRG